MSDKKSPPTGGEFSEKPSVATGIYMTSAIGITGTETASEKPTPSKLESAAKPPKPSR